MTNDEGRKRHNAKARRRKDAKGERTKWTSVAFSPKAPTVGCVLSAFVVKNPLSVSGRPAQRAPAVVGRPLTTQHLPDGPAQFVQTHETVEARGNLALLIKDEDPGFAGQAPL